MNTQQRVVLLGSAVVFLAIGLFPPWLIVSPAMTLSNTALPLQIHYHRFAPIFSPPETDEWHGRDLIGFGTSRKPITFDDPTLALPETARYVKLDVERLATEFLAIALACIALVLGLGSRRAAYNTVAGS